MRARECICAREGVREREGGRRERAGEGGGGARRVGGGGAEWRERRERREKREGGGRKRERNGRRETESARPRNERRRDYFQRHHHYRHRHRRRHHHFVILPFAGGRRRDVLRRLHHAGASPPPAPSLFLAFPLPSLLRHPTFPPPLFPLLSLASSAPRSPSLARCCPRARFRCAHPCRIRAGDWLPSESAMGSLSPRSRPSSTPDVYAPRADPHLYDIYIYIYIICYHCNKI